MRSTPRHCLTVVFQRHLPWALAAFSGLFLWSAFPPWKESGNAWFALAPLLGLLRFATPGRGFRLGLLSGFAFWFPSLAWLWRLTDNGGPWPLVVLGHLALAFYCSLYTGLFGAMVAAGWQRTSDPPRGRTGWLPLRDGAHALLAACLWAGLELLRATLLTGFAWNHLGVSQVGSRAILQTSALGGVVLVSALVLLVNATLANVAIRLWRGARGFAAPRWHGDLLLALAVVTTAFLWGNREIRRWEERIARGPVLTVASVQPNAPSVFERDATAVVAVEDRLTELTARVALFHPDLIVWPETALFGVVPRDPEAMEFAAETARRSGRPLLTGAVEVSACEGRRPLVANASWMFQPDGSVSDRYRKQHLVPFGEFIPLDRWFPWLERLSPIGYSCTPGRGSVLMNVPMRSAWSARGADSTLSDGPVAVLSPLICFEDTVSALARNAVRKGATVLVNQSNDAWFHGSSEADQHHAQAVFRAVEHRVPLVRCSNAGISTVVDPTGLSGKSANYFVLPLTPRQDHWPLSPYTRWGDWIFGWPCVGIGVIAAIRLRRKRGCRNALRGGLRLLLLAVAIPAFSAKAGAPPEPPVVVLYGEQSVDPADRTYSRAMARNLERWLDEAGLPAAAYPDSAAAEGLKPPRKVAHLVNLLHPPSPVLRTIDAFLARGGKVVVYNSASPDLAARLGVKVGPYRRAPSFGAWTQFRFVEPLMRNAPAVVRQSSAALHDASPADPATRVAAWWEDRNGRRTPYPAWLSHPNGFWMSHVLLADADGRSRSALLAALTGACAPAAWRFASDTLVLRLGSAVGAPDFATAKLLLHRGTPPADKPAVERILREADGIHGTILTDRRDGRHAVATASLWHLKTLLTEASAVQQAPWRDCRRAVWDHGGFGLFLGDWEQTCATLSRYGMTDLFLLVATPTTTHATIPGLAHSRLRLDHGDQLAAASAAAKRHNIRIHAWISVLKPMLATAGELETLQQQGLLLEDTDGRPTHWLNPAHPETLNRLRCTIRHLVRETGIDGIHLDYIRYPNLRSGLGPKARTAFERATGRTVPNWPDDVLSPKNERHRELISRRSRLVTALLSATRSEIRSSNRPLTLSAAVFGRHPLCVDSVGQDWMRWLREGTLDWAVPMNYTGDRAAYQRLIREQATDPALRGRILSGIGVTAAECTLDALQVIRQIQATRAAGLGGYALFDLDATLGTEILPFLRLGVNRR